VAGDVLQLQDGFSMKRAIMRCVVQGMVVRAWDIAVATMKAGEKSRFYCKDIYVYTDEISQLNDTPGHNYIVYDIELIHWQGFVYLNFLHSRHSVP